MGRAVTAIPLLLISLFLALGCAESEDDPSVLRFSAIPDQDLSEQQVKYERVARYLSEQLGVAVEFQPTLSYRLSVEAFKNGDIDFAWFGGLTGVDARAYPACQRHAVAVPAAPGAYR